MSADIAISAVLLLCIIILHVLRDGVSNPLNKFVGNKYEIGAASTLGTRIVQQDYFGVKKNQDVLMLLLADGIGPNGEVAAKLSVDTFRELFDDPNAIHKPQYFFQRAANVAHKGIINTLGDRQGETSIVSAMINGDKLFYTLVGNCRVAIFRDGDLIPISEGQTIDVLARHRYNEGKISKQRTLELLNEHRRYNVLGQDSFQEIELFSKPLTLKKNDLIVLMSEGIFNTLRWVELEEVLAKQSSLQTLANDIINLVDHSPIIDKDNATILICRRK